MITLKIVSFLLLLAASAMLGHTAGAMVSGGTLTPYAKIGIGLLMAAVFLFIVSFIP